MARKQMVTRTMRTTVATLLCLDTVNAEPFNKTVTLSGTFKDKKSIIKEAKKILEDDVVSVAKLVDVVVEEKLYAMPEQDFIDHAIVLPSRNVKAEQ